MISFDQTSLSENAAKLLVVGVGGGGNNAVERMLADGINGADFMIINTDDQVLKVAKCPNKLLIGIQLTHGHGAGGNAEIGEQAALENEEQIRQALADYDMVFITAGMGGGTGTGAAPVVARICRELGILSVAVLTKPFSFEGSRKQLRALEGIDRVAEYADTVITISNDRLLEVSDPKTTLVQGFRLADGILQQGVQGISDLIVRPGEINLDFADVCSVMRDKGFAHIGIGRASGEGKAKGAAEMAISSPLLDTSINGARSVLVNINGGSEMSLFEYDEASTYITSKVDKDAEIICGTSIDPSLGDEMVITVIAADFDGNRPPKSVKVTPPAREISIPAEDKSNKYSMFGMRPVEKQTPSFVTKAITDDVPRDEDDGGQLKLFAEEEDDFASDVSLAPNHDYANDSFRTSRWDEDPIEQTSISDDEEELQLSTDLSQKEEPENFGFSSSRDERRTDESEKRAPLDIPFFLQRKRKQ